MIQQVRQRLTGDGDNEVPGGGEAVQTVGTGPEWPTQQVSTSPVISPQASGPSLIAVRP